jgi:diguanylate cyclase (GGDEF)-like protein
MRQAGEMIEQTLPNGQVIRFMLGDINGDGQLDQDDVEILTALSGDSYMCEFLMSRMTDEELAACDINSDGLINHADLAVLCNQVLSRLEMLSVTDELTGLMNRRGLKEKAYFKMRSAKRFGTPLSCVAIDIDYFKKVNDTYGHDAGDAMLCHVAKLLSDMMRATDIVARHGGEEFVLILEQTDKQGALQVAEKIRRKIAETPLQYQGQTIPLTISLGIDSLDEETTLQQLIKNADTALYQAKNEGRNRTCVYDQLENMNGLTEG